MWNLLLLLCVVDTSCGGEEVMNAVVAVVWTRLWLLLGAVSYGS